MLPQATPHTLSVLPNLKYYRLTLTCMPNMPGRSSAVEEPINAGFPLSLLGATGGTLGGAGKDNHIGNPQRGLQVLRQPTPLLLKGSTDGKNSLLVRIFTARERRSLEPHAWVEDLLKDFFQLILGINLTVILLSPTECLIFSGSHNQAMSWDESLRYAHQL